MSTSGASGSGGQTMSVPCGGACPQGFTCGTANGLDACRSATGIPLFTHVFVILMENTSLSTLKSAIAAKNAPNFGMLASSGAVSTNYHGVAHPSLPNYVALTSGDTQGIACDCAAASGKGACSALDCNLVLGTCTCTNGATNLGDQLESTGQTWMAFGESMSTPCNVTDSTNYAVRHLPFLYYEDIQGDAARCNSHVVDMSMFTPSGSATFNFLAPNLIHDMHNPEPATTKNIENGDAWIGPAASAILASPDYTSGGLLVIVWDEDDDSGGITGSDDPIPMFLFSPYAKSGGYVSSLKADHYTLLATFEDGLGLARLGNAGKSRPGFADTLADFFPAN